MGSADASLACESVGETILDRNGDSLPWHEVDQQVNSSAQGSGKNELGNEAHSSHSSCFSPAAHQEPNLNVSTAFSATGSVPSSESAPASRSQVEESDVIQLKPEPFAHVAAEVFPHKCTQSVSSSSPERWAYCH